MFHYVIEWDSSPNTLPLSLSLCRIEMSITKRVKFSKTHEDQWLSIKFLADKAIYHDKNIFAWRKSLRPLHHLRFLRPACLVGENEGRRHKSYFQFPHQGQGDLSTTSPSSITTIMKERHHLYNSWIFYQLFIAITIYSHKAKKILLYSQELRL